MDAVQVEKAVEPLFAQEGVELVDMRMGRHGNKTLIQFFLDRIQGSVTLDDCEKMSEKIGAVLDCNNLVDGQYTLEVSSPGFDRVLKKDSHFLRFVGQRVKVRLKIPLEERRVFYGVISGFEDNCVLLTDGAATYRFPLAGIEEARLNPVY